MCDQQENICPFLAIMNIGRIYALPLFIITCMSGEAHLIFPIFSNKFHQRNVWPIHIHPAKTVHPYLFCLSAEKVLSPFLLSSTDIMKIMIKIAEFMIAN